MSFGYVLYQSIPKLPITSRTFSRHFSFFFLSNFPVCWHCTWSNTPPASTSESVKSSTEWSFNNFPVRQTVYSKCEHPAKHSWNILSLRKLFYSGLFIKICHSRNPTFNRPFKRLSNAPTNTEYWSNALHMLNVERITKSFCLQRQNFDMKVKCLTGCSSFWVKLSIVWSKTPVKCPGREDGQFWNCVVDYVRERLVCYPRRGL